MNTTFKQTDDYIVIQSVGSTKICTHSGTEECCNNWIGKLPEVIRNQFSVYTLVLTLCSQE